jgi:uncharacterized protein (DUF983 family)
VNHADPRSWPDKLIGLCLGFLLAAITLYVGVQLIASVWQVLLIIVAFVTTVMFTVAIIHSRNRGW